jgi:hypothetical protein
MRSAKYLKKKEHSTHSPMETVLVKQMLYYTKQRGQLTRTEPSTNVNRNNSQRHLAYCNTCCGIISSSVTTFLSGTEIMHLLPLYF